MKKLLLIAFLTMALALVAPFNCALAGPALQALNNAICNSTSPYAYKAGCKGYFQLRIIHDGNKEQALRWCISGNNGCDKFFDGDQLAKCQEGCQFANSQDN